ncbi:MAG TPA: hypothetical protein ENJ28_04965 [Gammaproteobacteria bacterium]|nr:hypothetical protein [Gammaproteobacteria bacterium]
MTGMNSKTLESTYEERVGSGKKDGFRTGFAAQDFEDITAIFVLAKTWGAAHHFIHKTDLDRKFRIPVKYLTRVKQIQYAHNRSNTLIIALERYAENEDNKKCISLAKQKNLRFLNYKFS